MAARKVSEFPLDRHDHRVCVAGSLAAAESICAQRGARLTPKRRAVLELMLEDHVPLSAYEIAERVQWGEKRPASVAIYRVLAFFESLGLVHRIESLKAYLACSRPLKAHGACFLVCTACGKTAESSDAELSRVLEGLAARASFRLSTPVVELKGQCPDCAGTVSRKS